MLKVKTEKFYDFEEDEKEGNVNNDFLNNIKDEIDIDETPIQFFNREFPCDIAIGSVEHEVRADSFDGCYKEEEEENKDINNDFLSKIKDVIDIDENQIQFFNREFPCDVAIGSVEHEVNTDNFHEYEDKQDEVEKKDDDDDDADVFDYIEDEIEIDEKQIHLFNKEFPCDIAIGSVNHENESIEPDYSGKSQPCKDLEFKLFGRVAVVRFCRLEDLVTKTEQTLEGQCSSWINEDWNEFSIVRYSDGPSLATESCNSAEEGRPLLRFLREYRISKSGSKQSAGTREQNSTKNADTVQKSIKRRSIRTFQCSMCTFTCLTNARLEVHLRSHGEKKHACSVCGYEAQDSSLLATHSKIHAAGKPPYKCDVCDYKTNRKYRFVKHIFRMHTGEKPYKCGTCNFQTTNKYGLKSHIIRKHTKAAHKYSLNLHNQTHTGGQKRFCCSQCDSKFSYLSNLKDHERCIHRGEEPYSCTMCDYRNFSSRNLLFHKRIHTEEKNLSCDECNYKCSKPSKLNEHRRIHSGDKPYKCGMCQYRASRLGHLKLHTRTHTNEKPYCCDQCDYKCSSSSALLVHKVKHTDKTPVSCDSCGFKCSSLGNLKTHIRAHNGERPSKK